MAVRRKRIQSSGMGISSKRLQKPYILLSRTSHRDAWLKKTMVSRPQKRVALKRKKSPANKAQKRAARATSGRR